MSLFLPSHAKHALTKCALAKPRPRPLHFGTLSARFERTDRPFNGESGQAFYVNKKSI